MLKPLNRQNVPHFTSYPEKFIFFGGGNFLRAFAGWMVEVMNEEAGLEAGVVIVKPTSQGSYEKLKAQDGLYHVRVTGGERGETRLIRCVNEIVNPYTDFDAFQELARRPSIRFIVSNTTEVGITFEAADRLEDRPGSSFPAKLTQFLYARFRHFGPDPTKGCIVLPCELVEQNGDRLRQMVEAYADLWQLGREFKRWLGDSCAFCNSLVDRIVPGFPHEKAADIWNALGFEDQLLVEAEPYHQWVIEGPNWAAELPVEQTELNVRFVKDVNPYRELKVRILNGAHTALTPVGFLGALDTVREAVEDEDTGRFIRSLLVKEVLPVLDFPPADLEAYMEATLERFRNPEIHHQLLDIALNSLSKFRVRLLPSLLEYSGRYGRLPERIVFSLAALIHFYRGRRMGVAFAQRDEPAVLAWFNKLWAELPPWRQMADQVLQQNAFWGRDLTAVSGLPERLSYYLKQIDEAGIKDSLRQLNKDEHGS